MVGDLWTMLPTNPEVFTVRLTGAKIHNCGWPGPAAGAITTANRRYATHDPVQAERTHRKFIAQ